jgi:hypothetical protein
MILSGMGGMSDDAGPKRIPDPDRPFEVTLVDRADVRTQMTNFSIEGLTYFFGNKGKGKMAIPFDKIGRADFSSGTDGLFVLLGLRDGQQVTLKADPYQKCYGLTGIGNFEIELGDVKAIVFNKSKIPVQSKK